MFMYTDLCRDRHNTSEEMKQCCRQLLQPQRGGVGPAGQQVGLCGGVSTVTAVFLNLFLNGVCHPPIISPFLRPPTPPIPPTRIPLSSLTQNKFKFSSKMRPHAAICDLIWALSFLLVLSCNVILPIKTGNSHALLQGAFPETTKVQIRDSS